MVEAIRQGDIPGVQLRCRRQLAASPEEIWPWLVEPEPLCRWLADEAKVDAEGHLLLTTRLDDGSELRESAVPLATEPPSRQILAFERLGAGWPTKTRVVFEIEATAEGAEISVLHERFQNLPLSISLTVWEAYRRRWSEALSKLASAIGD